MAGWIYLPTGRRELTTFGLTDVLRRNNEINQPKIIWNKTIFSRIQDSLQPSKKIKLPYATYLILIKESRYELFSKINRQIFVKTDVSSQKYSLLEKYILMELVSELLTM